MESYPYSHTPTVKKRGLIDRYFQKIHVLKPSDAFLLKIALLACIIFFVLFIIELSKHYSMPIAARGGTFQEGVVGTPSSINPVLASTRADDDLIALVYDGLMKLGPDGHIIPNIAESVTISDDGLTYNVIMKQGVTFHDGTPLTARDVLFTIEKIQDPPATTITNPLHANFDGIKVEQINDYELNFILPEAYAPFIENLTFGILPEHIWKNATAEVFLTSYYNTEPIGSGPYKVEKITRNAVGVPEVYYLSSYEGYHRGAPKIEKIEMHFFANEEEARTAFINGTVESVIGVDPQNLQAYERDEVNYHIERIPLPRTFALFLNQNKSAALRDPAVRKALHITVDRKALIDTVFSGYANPLSSPITTGFGDSIRPYEETLQNLDAARDILREGGWKLNPDKQVWEKEIDKTFTPLAFDITTLNNSSFEATAEFLRKTWSELGVSVQVKQFETSDLTQSVIRPRDYESLLFGTQIGRSLDYYSFWHSSQRNDPGINVALYANITTDSILSEMRRGTDIEKRDEALGRFADEISKETPAIFLYAPELLYVFPNRVHGAVFKGMEEPQERFSNVHEWYIETDSIWPLFGKSQT